MKISEIFEVLKPPSIKALNIATAVPRESDSSAVIRYLWKGLIHDEESNSDQHFNCRLKVKVLSWLWILVTNIS